MKASLQWTFLAGVFGYALACRVLPYLLYSLGMPIDPETTWYPWNFSPVVATCVLCGAVIPQTRRTAVLLAVLMLGGDLLIDLITGFKWWTLRNQFVQLWVYAAVGLVALLGRQLRSRPGLVWGIPAALVGEVAFFLITNFAVWLSGPVPGGEPPLYPLTAAGLVACYVAGLKTFTYGLASTAVYAGLFFSPWGLGLAGVVPPTAPPRVVDPRYEAA